MTRRRRVRSRPAPTGSAGCNRKMEASRPSTPTPIRNGSINFRSPMSKQITDPSCPDLTGRVLEMLGALHRTQEDPVARRAIEWLQAQPVARGFMVGAMGRQSHLRNFLRAAGTARDRRRPSRSRGFGARWNGSNPRQNDDGGWGESCLSDKDPSWRGRGASTASQTAWALIGILAGEDELGDQCCAACDGCWSGRTAAGSWDETAFTGNGFPNHFYMRYYLYPHYFPLARAGRVQGAPGRARMTRKTRASRCKGGELIRMRRTSDRGLAHRAPSAAGVNRSRPLAARL